MVVAGPHTSTPPIVPARTTISTSTLRLTLAQRAPMSQFPSLKDQDREKEEEDRLRERDHPVQTQQSVLHEHIGEPANDACDLLEIRLVDE